jgi:RNA recognition motif-containing protein
LQEEKTELEESVPPPKKEPSDTAAKGEDDAKTSADTNDGTAIDTNTPNQSKVPASETEASDEQQKSKRVYVGNLAWEVSSQDLKDHAEQAGLEAKLANVMISHDGRSKGCGIIEFHTTAVAQQAVLVLNDTELRGRQIFVREDREEHRSSGDVGVGSNVARQFSSRENTRSRRVYVGNLSWDVAWQDLKDHMREAGEVVHAEIIRDANGRSKGCGVVEFSSEDDAQNAISTLTDSELKGRMIFIREDRESSNQSGIGGGSAGGRSHQNTSVYVWNLTPETSWQDLKDHMRKAGNVDSATVLTNAQGESLCCGVVAYQKPQEAIRAIRELQNSELKGQSIYVREDRVQSQAGARGYSRGSGGRSGGGRGRSGRGTVGRGGRGGRSDENGTQLFVGNLSPETTWRELKDHFRQCGEVAHAEVKSTPQGQSRGFGIVTFSTREEAEAAIAALNSSELQGSQLEVRFDQRTR